MGTIHLVCDRWQRDVVKSVLKHCQVKDQVRVCRPGSPLAWEEGDTPVVWHGGDTASTILFYYLCAAVPGDLYEIDYTHADPYAEQGYSLVAIGQNAIVRAGCVGKQAPVSDAVRREAAARWDRLCLDPSKPLMLMCEDGIVRNYPKDYLDDWLLGIIKRFLTNKKTLSVSHAVGNALGFMYNANNDVLGTSFFEKRLSLLVKSGRFKTEGNRILYDGSFESIDDAWLNDDSDEWASYRHWKEKSIH